MPFTNEHSARLLDPNTKKIRVGRTHGSGDGKVQGVKVPSTIDIIWYIVKGKDKKEVPVAQALRFPTKNWTAPSALKWLKDNKIKYIEFVKAEPAKKNSAPEGACIFALKDSQIDFKAENDATGSGKFAIIAYSGKIIPNHWYWGNLAFDLKGLKFAKKPMPILAEHGRNDRIGIGSELEITDAVRVGGTFLSNTKAQELRRDMAEGFPMEASVYLPPDSVEYVEKGASVEVNGQTLHGPGAVIRKGTIREVSMCTLGADSQTVSAALAAEEKSEVKFSIFDKEIKTMGNEENTSTIELDASTFAEQYPALHSEIVTAAKEEGIKEGSKAERQRFEEFAEQFGDDPAFCIEQLKAGVGLDEAVKMYATKLKTEKSQLEEDLKKAQKEKGKVDPARQEFSDDADKDKTKGGGTAKTKEQQWQEEFAKSEDLQTEFGGNVNCYIGYMKAEEAGRVR